MSRSSDESVDSPPSTQDLLKLLCQALAKVPCGRGDHTDLCRMHNQGLPPFTDDHCRCHVGTVRAALGACHSWRGRSSP